MCIKIHQEGKIWEVLPIIVPVLPKTRGVYPMFRVVERNDQRRVGRAVLQEKMWTPNVDVSAASPWRRNKQIS